MSGSPISKNLVQILSLQEGNLDRKVDLKKLSERVAMSFGADSELAAALLKGVTGEMPMATLGTCLLNILAVDSAVRDIQTTGHLAKLLSRLDIFRKTSDYRIVGMPNQLFDAISQAERTNYFEGGNILALDGELFDLPDVRAMMDSEAKLLQKFSSARVNRRR